jgi:hypothetical protein
MKATAPAAAKTKIPMISPQDISDTGRPAEPALSPLREPNLEAQNKAQPKTEGKVLQFVAKLCFRQAKR